MATENLEAQLREQLTASIKAKDLKTANLIRSVRQAGQKIIVVAGPVVVHTGGAASLSRLIRNGYVQALLSGKLDAAIVPPPFNFEAESKGFLRLMAAADVFETSVSGLALHNDMLKERPGQVKRMLRALLKAQNFIRANKVESVRVIADWLKLDTGIAQSSYDIYVKGMSLNGMVPERVLETDIERARKEQNVKEAIPVHRVVDFTVLKEALNDLGMR